MKKALISVSDKSRLIELATGLIEADYEIISTGNTYKYLIENNIEAKEVSDITNFKEMLDGRVKTLHPFVHGGILARRDVPEHMASLKEEGIWFASISILSKAPFKKKKYFLKMQSKTLILADQQCSVQPQRTSKTSLSSVILKTTIKY